MLAHFRPVGNPPPPRPRNPAGPTWAIVSEGPISCARCRPRPPVSLARYSSREEMGEGGSRKAVTLQSFRSVNPLRGPRSTYDFDDVVTGGWLGHGGVDAVHVRGDGWAEASGRSGGGTVSG